MVINTIFLASLGFLTLPLYTIAVQMGGTFKPQLLSKEIVDNAIRVHSMKVCNPLSVVSLNCTDLS